MRMARGPVGGVTVGGFGDGEGAACLAHEAAEARSSMSPW